MNLSSLTSFCIRNTIKFVQPLNPGPLARCSKVLTTRFLDIIFSISSITWDFVIFFKSEFDFCHQRTKLHFPTNFKSIWWKSPKSHFFRPKFGVKFDEKFDFHQIDSKFVGMCYRGPQKLCTTSFLGSFKVFNIRSKFFNNRSKFLKKAKFRHFFRSKFFAFKVFELSETKTSISSFNKKKRFF